MTDSDRYDTPVAVANALVACVTDGFVVRTVADFAAGGGALLDAAQIRWPDASILAADVDRECARRLRQQHRNWRVSCLDFLSLSARNASAHLRQAKDLPVILLNPPFTCRGAKTERVVFEGTPIDCSVALAFVLTAASYLAARGQLVAVLPQGSLASAKDSEAWLLLTRFFDIELRQRLDARAFSGAVVHTSIVSFAKRATPRFGIQGLVESGAVMAKALVVEVVRGGIQLHNAKFDSGGVPLIHTTDLRNSRVAIGSRKVRESRSRVLSGPAVLLPRVGAPRLDKICVLEEAREVAISDCVLAIRCASHEQAASAADMIRRCWDDLARQYRGTCAPYLQVAALRQWLSTIGILVTADSLPSPILSNGQLAIG